MSSHPVIIPTASLHGKVALITGASRGIGRGCALELARRGCKVVINYAKSKQAADDAVNAIVDVAGSTDAAISIQADVTKVSEIERLFQEAADHFGRIDFVFSNSGAESFDKTEEISEAQYDYVFSLNTKAQFFVAKTAWKYLQDGGRVVLMSSLAAGALGIKDHALYNSSKLAVVGMVKAFATDFGSRRITVNGIAPGGIVSDMFYENAWRYIPGATADWPFDTIENMVANRTPLGRCGVPEDIARVVAFLMSEDGGWVNGKQSTSRTDMEWLQMFNHLQQGKFSPLLVVIPRITGVLKRTMNLMEISGVALPIHVATGHAQLLGLVVVSDFFTSIYVASLVNLGTIHKYSPVIFYSYAAIGRVKINI